MNIRQRIDQNYEWFKENKNSILTEPNNLFVIIKDTKFVASFKTWEEAIQFAERNHFEEGFIVQSLRENLKNYLGFLSLGL